MISSWNNLSIILNSKNTNESILRRFSFYFSPHFFHFLKVSNKIVVNLIYFPLLVAHEHNYGLCITGNMIRFHQNNNSVGR